VLQVFPAPLTPGTLGLLSAEDLREYIGVVAAGDREVESLESVARHRHLRLFGRYLTQTVIAFARLGCGEDFKGLANPLIVHFSGTVAGIDIRMELPRQATKGAAQVVYRRRPLNAQENVIVALAHSGNSLIAVY
jgi:hypothetical protein